MSRLHLTFLGGFHARLASGAALALPTRKAQALLAYLALPAGQAHPRDKLAALLWGGIREESARASLRQALFAIRKALGDDAAAVLRQEGETLVLDAASIEVDVTSFEHAVKEASPTSLARAGELYRGDLLAGLVIDEAPFEEWLLGERERLRELALEALAKLLVHQRSSGAPEPAVVTALKLLTLDPLQEPVHRALMRLYADLGRRGAALRQYQQCVGVLQRELGTEPEAETKQLYEETLRARSSRASGPSAAAVSASVPATAVHAVLPSARKTSAFVGRAAPMAHLTAAIDRAIAGHGNLVVVLGEAGVGKSRLVAEFATEAGARGVSVLTGRAYESEQILAFGPWVDALRAARVATETELLERLDPAWRSELARLLPGIGTPPRDAVEPRRLFEAVAAVLECLAAAHPLVLVLEDLHWADEMSCRLLAFVGRQLGAWPIVVVLTARADEIDEAPALGRTLDELERDGLLARVALAPLSRGETDALVRSLARAGSDESDVARLAEQAWVVSEGNPFVAVETVVAATEGAMAPAPSGMPDIPETVREIITRRLARLSARARVAADVASVIGREFEFPLLHRASGLDEAAAAGGIEELVRRGLLHGVGERFDFTHDRIRETAYAEILGPRRRLVHRQVAEALETVHAKDLEPHALALGRHYREAELWDQAARHLHTAGTSALARSANREAVSCLDLALDAVAHLPESPEKMQRTIDAWVTQETGLMGLGDFTRSIAQLHEAKVLAERLGDRVRLGRVFGRLGYNLASIGDLDGAIDAGERGRAIAIEEQNIRVHAGSNVVLARALYARGEYRRAMEAVQQNDELGRRPVSDPRIRPNLCFSRIWGVLALAELGEFAEATTCGDEALRLSGSEFARHGEVWADLGVGRLRLVKGDLQGAIDVLQHGLPLCETRTDLAVYFSRTAASLGAAYALSGRLADALALLERAVAHGESIGFAYAQPLVMATLGEARLLAGESAEAARQAARALALARQSGQRGWEAWAARLDGEIALARGASDEANARFHEAIVLAETREMRPLLAHCQLGLAGVEARRGTPEAARAHLSGALTKYRAMEMPYWIARAEGELARLG